MNILPPAEGWKCNDRCKSERAAMRSPSLGLHGSRLEMNVFNMLICLAKTVLNHCVAQKEQEDQETDTCRKPRSLFKTFVNLKALIDAVWAVKERSRSVLVLQRTLHIFKPRQEVLSNFSGILLVCMWFLCKSLCATMLMCKYPQVHVTENIPCASFRCASARCAFFLAP